MDFSGIRRARKAANLTQNELADILGINRATVSKYESGQIEPTIGQLSRIAIALHTNVQDMMGRNWDGWGKLDSSDAFGDVTFPNENSLTDDKIITPSIEESRAIKKYRALDKHGKDVVDSALNLEYRRIEQATQSSPDPESEENVIRFPLPFYHQASSAGFGDWADSEYAEKVMLVKEPPFGAAFIIPVNGDSMEPTYPDGCKVFVRPQHEVREGQVGIFFMDGKLWIKQLGSDALISHNPDYPPQPFQEDLRCWGLVVGICDDSYFEH